MMIGEERMIRKKDIKAFINTFINTLFIISILIFSVITTFVDIKYNIVMYSLILTLLVTGFISNYKVLKSRTIAVLILFSTYTFLITLLYFGFDFQLLWRTVRIPFTILIGFFYARKSSEKNRKTMYAIVYIMILISIGYGFYQKIMGIGWGYHSRMDSFFGQPIIYANIICFAFWLTFYIFKKNIFRIPFIIYILAGLLSTGSRSSWIALLISIIIYTYIFFRNNKITKKSFYRIIILMIGLIAFLFTDTFQGVYDTIFSRFSGMMNSTSAIQRLGSYGIIISNFITRNPLSILVGYGTSATNNLMGKNVVVLSDFYTADNQYLAILYDYGLIGATLAFAVIYKVTKSLFTIPVEGRFQEIQSISYCLICTFVCAFFYDMYGWLSISSLFSIFLGIFLYMANRA